MQYTKILFSAIVGAVIGYITNWLAIKMLFRPHKEKRIFGIKIPFTPGLIPKEQGRIAKSVGDAVGNHLLTKEAMVDALKDNKVDDKFKQLINKKIKSIINKNISIKDQLRNIIGVQFERIVFNSKNKLSNIILRTIRKEDFKVQFEDLIVDAIKVELRKSPKDIIESSYYNIVRRKLL
ncbi:hypothetical protein CBCST_19345, partial [Clostridium botulinum C str. Stockholm]